MNSEARLAEIIRILEEEGIPCLIMGGHAIRYYGIDRITIDYDVHLSADGWDDLPGRLQQSPLGRGKTLVEGPSWRRRNFRRFQIGTLPDGREEWLEFWKENHLLAPFAELYGRCEKGVYGGRILPFLSLPDLIRSKETERNSDWQDITLLEEILDARLIAQSRLGAIGLSDALARLRSRKGFESHLQQGNLANRDAVFAALSHARLPMTQAYLLPFAAARTSASPPDVEIEPIVFERLRTVTPGSALHLALVEAIRRQYKLRAQAVDRADKETFRAETAGPGT